MLENNDQIYMATIGVKIGNIRKLSVAVSEESAEWIEEQIKTQRFRNISHAIEVLIRNAKKEDQG
jgi:Arc/MetJ-type ribon-helix-helix transcriptional regulator